MKETGAKSPLHMKSVIAVGPLEVGVSHRSSCALSQVQPPAMDDAIQVRCSATSYGRRHPGALRMRVSKQLSPLVMRVSILGALSTRESNMTGNPAADGPVNEHRLDTLM